MTSEPDPYEGWLYRPDDPEIVAVVATFGTPDFQTAKTLARILGVKPRRHQTP